MRRLHLNLFVKRPLVRLLLLCSSTYIRAQSTCQFWHFTEVLSEEANVPALRNDFILTSAFVRHCLWSICQDSSTNSFPEKLHGQQRCQAMCPFDVCYEKRLLINWKLTPSLPCVVFHNNTLYNHMTFSLFIPHRERELIHESMTLSEVEYFKSCTVTGGGSKRHTQLTYLGRKT